MERRRRRRRRRVLETATTTAAKTTIAEIAPSSFHGGGYDGELVSETFDELYSPTTRGRRRRRREGFEGGGEVEEDHDDDDDGGGNARGGVGGGHGRRKPYLPQWLIDRAASLGYVRPTFLQKRALDVLLPSHRHDFHDDDDDDDDYNHRDEGERGGDYHDDVDDYDDARDAVLHGQTGSGKTLAYLLPLLGRIDPNRSATQAVVVVPTRELGHQVVRVARRLGAGIVGDGGGLGDDDDDDDYVVGGANVEDVVGGDLDPVDNSAGDDDIVNLMMNGNVDEMIGGEIIEKCNNPNNRITIMSILQGSSNFSRQRAWSKSDPPHVIVGTPEELTKMIVKGGILRGGSSSMMNVGMVVVDEVDACFSSTSISWKGGGGGRGVGGGGRGGSALHELLSRHLNPTYRVVETAVANMSVGGGGVGDDGPGKDGPTRTFRLSTSTSSSDDGDRRGMDQRAHRVRPRQTIFASATIPQHNHFARQCAKNGWTLRGAPVRVNVSPGELMPPTLDHVYVVCRDESNKVGGLRRWLKRELGGGDDDRPVSGAKGSTTRSYDDGDVAIAASANDDCRVLIFCNDGRQLDALAEMLARDWNGIIWKEGCYDLPAATIGAYDLTAGYDAVISTLRMNDSLGARAAAMGGFRGPPTKKTVPWDDDGVVRNAKLRIMISTDLAARGLDVPNVSHVINFDLPIDGDGGYDAYVHRGGRAGRLGRRGKVMSLVTSDQEFVLERLANKLSLDLKCVARQEGRGKKNSASLNK
ncbi:hypothetical protein ACHAXA_010833 [Cyclostephanos tholiformis]|uniref:Uncharacterized protein n=1 Tax=Cyclostephanos tholiformis TaxID=382380 RepID=A0ABD3SGG0_9STRA